MIKPKSIKLGDKIGIVSTASKIEQDIIERAAQLLIAEGFEIEIAPNAFSQFHQFAGTDIQRASDFQYFINNDNISAIICSRGGYGTLRTIQHINWDKFKKNPKWIVGFSDITVIHSILNTLNICSIHGVMTKHFFDDNTISQSFKHLKEVLTGEPIYYKIPPSKFNRYGIASGQVVGGNLSILYSLRGTEFDIETEGKILFIEDLSEYLYHLDRMMMNLKVGGKLKKLSALVVGGFTGMKDNEIPFGMNVEEIILDAVADYNYPVVFNFPAGHQINNFAIKFGEIAFLEVNKNGAFFKQV